MKLILLCALVAAALGGCSYINRQLGVPDENPAEEWIEDYIEREIGVQIDLSGETPE